MFLQKALLPHPRYSRPKINPSRVHCRFASRQSVRCRIILTMAYIVLCLGRRKRCHRQTLHETKQRSSEIVLMACRYYHLIHVVFAIHISISLVLVTTNRENKSETHANSAGKRYPWISTNNRDWSWEEDAQRRVLESSTKVNQ
jgi:hypothetical protein